MRHFLDLDLIAPADLRSILDEAHRMKKARLGQPKGMADKDASLQGHILAMIFEKSSTRTRVSFDVAMRQMGGSAVILDTHTSQLGRGETIADTSRVLSRMVDAIMLRANSHKSLLEMAKWASVPVINGLTDRSHPCQIMADLQTLEESGLALKGARIAWVGDGNNVLNSFIDAASAFEYSLIAACPNGFKPDAKTVENARTKGARIEITDDANIAALSADCVVTDTWVSMGDENVSQRMQAFAPYQVNEELMAKANARAIFLHCLPAHRGDEVTNAVMDGANSLVFAEAENRIHAQKAILRWCLEK
ncbi:MAG: ornithine carbamoyltransferase [Hyphomonadaceae bacterium]|nr:MAG: ornithine carbamoyltransferase [Hyphomonadaceae bacterium]